MVGLEGARAEGRASGGMAARDGVRRLELGPLIAGGEGGRGGVAVKCRDITKNPDCEGSLPAR